MKQPSIPPPELLATPTEELRALSLKQRGDRLIAACETAAIIAASRTEMGLPPYEPAPWPKSTIEFFRKHAPNGRKK